MTIGEEEYRGWLRVDPRTKLFYAFTISFFCMVQLGGNALPITIVRIALVCSVSVLLLATKRVKAAAIYIAVVGFLLAA